MKVKKKLFKQIFIFLVSTASNALNVDRIRDRIYAELHNNLIMNYGITGTGTRLGSLLCLIHDMNVCVPEREPTFWNPRIHGSRTPFRFRDPK